MAPPARAQDRHDSQIRALIPLVQHMLGDCARQDAKMFLLELSPIERQVLTKAWRKRGRIKQQHARQKHALTRRARSTSVLDPYAQPAR